MLRPACLAFSIKVQNPFYQPQRGYPTITTPKTSNLRILIRTPTSLPPRSQPSITNNPNRNKPKPPNHKPRLDHPTINIPKTFTLVSAHTNQPPDFIPNEDIPITPGGTAGMHAVNLPALGIDIMPLERERAKPEAVRHRSGGESLCGMLQKLSARHWGRRFMGRSEGRERGKSACAGGKTGKGGEWLEEAPGLFGNTGIWPIATALFGISELTAAV
ncbi:hypothetical protein KM043_011754 [Ampulex compressa]|nr:hypothetical protein KM043_011754 [Ampulex compressa]